MEDIKTNLSDAIAANDGSIQGIKKVSKEHGNVVTAPLSEFKHPSDYKPPPMHINNGMAKDMLTFQRKTSQQKDSKEMGVTSYCTHFWNTRITYTLINKPYVYTVKL